MQLIKTDSIYNVERGKIIKSLIMGVPSNLRGRIWKLLSQSRNVSLNHEKHFFYSLLEIKNDEVDFQIKKDIDRTFLMEKDPKFSKQNKVKLFNILKAYSVYDPQVGYCQGTNFIAMLILSQVNSTRSSFWTFVQVMHNKKWRNLFVNNTPKLIKILDKLALNIKLKLNDLYQHFEKENVK